jgi:hypothetical protein
LIDIKISRNDVFNFHKYFFCKKLECLSKSFKHVLLDNYSCHASDHNKNWTQECLIYKQNTFFVFSRKITKNSYKIIGSSFQFLDCENIANKKDLIEPLNKNFIWLATIKKSLSLANPPPPPPPALP